VIKKIISSYL